MFLRKKKLFTLDARLQTCADMVREGRPMADIGTDHAYLPIWLVKQARVPKAIAADVRVGPLQKAGFHVRRYGVERQVDTRISDGLELIFPNEADDIVIAGMGGLLIAEIIGKAPWLKDTQKYLILQPMTAAAELRAYLSEHGFAVVQERAVQDGEHIYTVMQAVYDPPHVQTGERFLQIGILQPDAPQSRAYIERVCIRLQKRVQGLQQSGKEPEELMRIETILRELQDLLR